MRDVNLRGSPDRTDDFLAQAGCISPQVVVVDAIEGSHPTGGNSAELLAHKLDTYRVVRALIVLPQPGANILYWGDDADSMTKVEEVFRTAGCSTTDCGTLAVAAPEFSARRD